jgi:hypothetical protein
MNGDEEDYGPQEREPASTPGDVEKALALSPCNCSAPTHGNRATMAHYVGCAIDNAPAIAAAIAAEREETKEQCAKIVNDARGTSYDLRSLVAAIRALK